MNHQLFNELYNASEYYRISNAYHDIITRYKNSIQNCKQKYTEIKTKKKSPVIINIIAFLFGSTSVSMAILPTQTDDSYSRIISLIFTILSAVIIVINTLRCKASNERNAKKADKLWYSELGPIVVENEKNIKKSTQELMKFKADNRDCVNFLPQEYRNYQATSYMALAVGKRRADTFKEAANLYEEQLHRWRIEQINEEIAYQNMAINSNLSNIYNQQVETNKRLRNIEDLEFYNMWYK